MSPPRPRLRRCGFVPTGVSDANDTRICHCGSLETDSVHRRTEPTDDQRAVEARRIGDR